ncbi:uncharacterized protein MAM_03533 [Metarhizium album ARSEF 1941]|uniref:Uncharacterized protein n=1 Tax=Metarhizium album (strain ARSEF 1941) TaxID=1081103 RepID=A0A0B2WXU8_METAS|nr:uncharacterized protein MAM_03533 [Metarhizium album ARSEF 1941]KHN98409.1 hypothetical protein MAM_03533 [Metarhizium album ARSEF 1941]
MLKTQSSAVDGEERARAKESDFGAVGVDVAAGPLFLDTRSIPLVRGTCRSFWACYEEPLKCKVGKVDEVQLSIPDCDRITEDEDTCLHHHRYDLAVWVAVWFGCYFGKFWYCCWPGRLPYVSDVTSCRLVGDAVELGAATCRSALAVPVCASS